MRRVLLPLVLVSLTGTLLAQTPRTIPLTQPNAFNATVSSISFQQVGDKLTMKDVRVEFGIGVIITADEATADKTNDGVMNFSGNVRMTLKKK